MTRTRTTETTEDAAVAEGVAEAEAEVVEEANKAKAANPTARRARKKGTGQINARHPGAAFAAQEGTMPMPAPHEVAPSRATNKPVTKGQTKVTNSRPLNKRIRCKHLSLVCHPSTSMLDTHGMGRTSNKP